MFAHKFFNAAISATHPGSLHLPRRKCLRCCARPDSSEPGFPLRAGLRMPSSKYSRQILLKAARDTPSVAEPPSFFFENWLCTHKDIKMESPKRAQRLEKGAEPPCLFSRLLPRGVWEYAWESLQRLSERVPVRKSQRSGKKSEREGETRPRGRLGRSRRTGRRCRFWAVYDLGCLCAR